MPQYYVYIMANRSKTLYLGVTNNLERRVYEHKHSVIEGFTSRYHLMKLVYYETAEEIESAIGREKQVKGWLRRKKVALIESTNPEWDDLSDTWYTEQRDPSLRSGGQPADRHEAIVQARRPRARRWIAQCMVGRLQY